jgi:hypothetical protein
MPNKKPFILESIRITLLCAIVSILFWLLGANNKTILIVFNMAVMSAAATFAPQRKPARFIVVGSGTMVLAIVIAGALGFYLPFWSKIIGIALAGLAFYLPKKRATANICVTSVVMFFVFASIPFDLQHAIHYLLSGAAVVILFLGFHRLIDHKIHPNQLSDLTALNKNRVQSSAITVLALILGWVCVYFLRANTSLEHLYWVALTILVIIQGSQGKTIKTSLIRIAVNTAGALVTVILFTYVMPAIFWLDMVMLVVFLFLIFALGYSMVYRTLFIELFVLGFTHILGKYQNIIAYDRILLTLIGGSLVILSTLVVQALRQLPTIRRMR